MATAGAPPTDSELVRRCQARDPAAAREIVRRYEVQLLRVVDRLVGRRSVAEEIVQEAFLRTFGRIDRIAPEQGIKGWLLQTAVNHARDHLRRTRGTETERAVVDPDLLRSRSDPERETSDVEIQTAVEHAIAQLPPKLREVMLLRYAEGLSFAEVAAIVGAPIPAVTMRALRARARLRSILQEYIR